MIGMGRALAALAVTVMVGFGLAAGAQVVTEIIDPPWKTRCWKPGQLPSTN